MMAYRLRSTASDTLKKRSLLRRMVVLHAALLFFLLLILARLLELQVVSADAYSKDGRHGYDRHIRAKRGEILAINSKTGETATLATNATLDMVYVDPLLVDNSTQVAEALANTLLTPEFHAACSAGHDDCPRELYPIYSAAFDPMSLIHDIGTGSILEPIPYGSALPIIPPENLPDITEARRQFARSIESRISQKVVTDITVMDGANKKQRAAVAALGLQGVFVDSRTGRVSANPEMIPADATAIAEKLAATLGLDPQGILPLLRKRDLRYVPVMRRLSSQLSLRLKELKLQSLKQTQEQRAAAPNIQAAEAIEDPYRCIALLPEYWRFYPDGTIASQVVGFLNVKQEAQYGIERTFDPQLRGQEGIISMVSDRQGRNILTSEQTIVDPHDGESIVLTIDPFIQRSVEEILQRGLEKARADSAQALVVDPFTGRILAMANAPLFERNSYSDVYEKQAILLPPEKEREIAVEVYHPETNVRVANAYYQDIFTPEGRKQLPEKIREELDEVESLAELEDASRFFLYLGQNTRMELFKTDQPGVWLKYRNTIGVGAYLNRNIQTIYEPGSVMKPVTMAIAIDQGELTPNTTYNDTAPVVKDEKNVIKNALLTYYGVVTMTNCLEFSINTCMTSVSDRLGKKLFHRMLERFGFGRLTGIELEDEQPGFLKPWLTWSDTELATIAFGQGISATPLQMTMAFAALANGGKLMRPIIIDRIIHADGTEERREPEVLDQVITPQTSDTITSMLVSTVEHGYARTAKVPGYLVAGKTGTSQIAGPGGKYEAGTGSVVASFMGFAPIDHPQFLVLIKFDRPKDKEISHGAGSAAPVFKEIAAFLFKYYGIPPDDLKR